MKKLAVRSATPPASPGRSLRRSRKSQEAAPPPPLNPLLDRSVPSRLKGSLAPRPSSSSSSLRRAGSWPSAAPRVQQPTRLFIEMGDIPEHLRHLPRHLARASLRAAGAAQTDASAGASKSSSPTAAPTRTARTSISFSPAVAPATSPSRHSRAADGARSNSPSVSEIAKGGGDKAKSEQKNAAPQSPSKPSKVSPNGLAKGPTADRPTAARVTAPAPSEQSFAKKKSRG